LVPIPTNLTAKGKTGRAVDAEPLVRAGLVRLAAPAYPKVVTLKGITRNAFLAQVEGFRFGDREAEKRADDLLDCLTYGVLVGFEVDKVQNWLLESALARAAAQ
jgi:hypothetical protein